MEMYSDFNVYLRKFRNQRCNFNVKKEVVNKVRSKIAELIPFRKPTCIWYEEDKPREQYKESRSAKLYKKGKLIFRTKIIATITKNRQW